MGDKNISTRALYAIISVTNKNSHQRVCLILLCFIQSLACVMDQSRAKGCLRSNYGLKTYTPEQTKEQWRESMRGEKRLSDSHLLTSKCSEALSKAWKTNFSRHICSDVPLNYFNTNKKHDRISTYDRTFHIKAGYCSKLHRDDREHTRGLNVNSEEQTKSVPVLSSSLYGHRPPLEIPSRRHVRVATVKRDFFRDSGTNIPLL